MESMTGAPYLMNKHRGGARIGHDVIVDSMMMDGLEDAYSPGKAMGVFAEDAAAQYQFTREAMDEYAIESLTRAKNAIASGAFKAEIVPVEVATRRGPVTVSEDEQPGKADPAKIPTQDAFAVASQNKAEAAQKAGKFADEIVPVTISTRKGDVVVDQDEYIRHGATLEAMEKLKPAFVKDGAVTAANSSSISDGAAAMVMTRESTAKALGLPIVARVVSHAAHAHEPALFTTAPVPAMQKALKKAGWSVEDVDLWEVNEAFAVVAMIAQQELGIDRAKLNVNGGATALGHPIGASGARILSTLLAALQARGGKKGVASLCIGGGEAVAMAVELV